MAAPKFPLTMGDGTKARTLEELQAHADLYTLEQRVSDQRLARWLADRGYEAQKAQVEQLQVGSSNFHQQLCEALGIPWSEILWKDYQAQKNKEEERQKAKERMEEEQRKSEERAKEEERRAKEKLKEEIPSFYCGISETVADKIASFTDMFGYSIRDAFHRDNRAIEIKACYTVFCGKLH